MASSHLRPRLERSARAVDGSFDVREGAASDAPVFLGGFYIIDVASIEVAVEWARRGRFIPGENEVRQILA